MTEIKMDIETVALNAEGTKLVLIDQTKLPNDIVWLEIEEIEDVWTAIHTLAVRGAPAIGVAAAGGVALAAQKIEADNYAEFVKEFTAKKEYLASSRPTAVNLFWALDRMAKVVADNGDKTVTEIKKLLIDDANVIKNEDIETCRKIGEHALPLIKDCTAVLTHCNAGRLATVKYGTALSPIYLAKEQGIDIAVFSDETRPLLQGARLTVSELVSAGIETTAICDNMAATVMAKGMVQAVIVGADRIAANGDTANKIGTSGVAIMAKYYGVPFYVAAPKSTIDMTTAVGADIEIEERDGEEIKSLWYEKPMVMAGAKTFNPAFDVSDFANITAIITEDGVVYPPFSENLPKLFK